MSVRVVIISYNSKEYTETCINSIIRYYPSANIYVVDNASSDGTQERIRELFPSVVLIENDSNLGYSKAINIGAKDATEDFLILSNADVVFKQDTISNLIKELDILSPVGLAAPKQFYPNGKIQLSSALLPGIKSILLNFSMLGPVVYKLCSLFSITLEYLDGALLAVRTETFAKVYGFDESFYFYSEDADFSAKIKKCNLKLKVISNALLIHHRGASTNINGINRIAIKQFVSAKIQLSNKYNSNFITRIYSLSEYCNSKFYSIIASILGNIFKIEKFNFKAKYYKYLTQEWKNAIAIRQINS